MESGASSVATEDETLSHRADPLGKFHTLVRADSLNNHLWKYREARFLSSGSE